MKIKIKKENIENFLLFIAIFLSIYLSYGFAYRLFVIFLCAATLVCVHWKIKLNTYFIFEFLFTLFVMLQWITRITADNDLTSGMAKRLFFNLIFDICIYNLLLIKSKDHFGQSYKDGPVGKYYYPLFSSLCLLMTIGIVTGEIFSLRFSTNDINLSLGGISIGVGTGTTVGYLAALSFAAANILYFENKDKKIGIVALLMFLLVLLSGTRKALLLCCGIYIFCSLRKEKNFNKLFRIIFVAIALIIIGYLIMHIPRLYEIIGVRFERLYVQYTTGNIVDRSANLRNSMGLAAIELFKERFLYGWGAYTFPAVTDFNYVYCHNNYLEILFSTGLIGGILYYSKYVVLIFSLFQARKKAATDNLKYLFDSLLALFLLILIMEYWQVSYHRVQFEIIKIIILASCSFYQTKNINGELVQPYYYK